MLRGYAEQTVYKQIKQCNKMTTVKIILMNHTDEKIPILVPEKKENL